MAGPLVTFSVRVNALSRRCVRFLPSPSSPSDVAGKKGKPKSEHPTFDALSRTRNVTERPEDALCIGCRQGITSVPSSGSRIRRLAVGPSGQGGLRLSDGTVSEILTNRLRSYRPSLAYSQEPDSQGLIRHPGSCPSGEGSQTDGLVHFTRPSDDRK